MLSLLAMVEPTVQGQPNGNHGPQDKDYSIPSGAYFASPDGSGGAPCSKGNPCSLKNALSLAPSGRTVVLMGGTYRTSGFNGRIPRSLTIQPHPGQKVILKGSKIASQWQSVSGGWKTKWSTLFPAKYPSNVNKSAIIDPAHPMAASKDMVFINGTRLKQVESKGQLGSGKFYVDYSNKTIFVGSDPRGKTVEITATQWGLYTGASNITVRGLTFTHYAGGGMKVLNSNIELENNDFSYNAVSGFKLSGAHKAVIRNNRVSHNGLQGVAVNTASHYLLFENNEITHNNANKYNPHWASAGIKILQSNAPVVRNNLFKDNDAKGIWTDTNVNGAVIVGNLVQYNTVYGIFIEASNDAIIAGNVVTHCGLPAEETTGAGIIIMNSYNAKIFNNTLFKNKINMRVGDHFRFAGDEYATRNTVVKNNIMTDATIDEFPAAQLWVAQQKCGDAVIKALDHNAYHKTNGAPNWLVRWKIGNNSCNLPEKFDKLSELEDAFDCGGSSISVSGSDPFFVDRSSNNFKLRQGSDAIKAGEALPSDVKAALGWNISGSVDLGAYQSGYSGGGSSPAPSAPSAGNLPWVEKFDSNTSYKGSLETGSKYKNGTFKVQNGKLTARGVGKVAYKTEVIDLEGKTVDFSMVLSSIGPLETNDNIKVYYRLNGGGEQLVATAASKISGDKLVTKKGVKGNTLQIVVRFKNSDVSEYYMLDNVKVEVSGSSSREDDSAKEIAEVQQEEQMEEIVPKENKVEVYPNPVASFMQVEVQSIESNAVNMVMYDMSGSKVYEASQLRTNETLSVDLSSLNPGIYLLQIIDEQGKKETQRIIKQ